MDVPDEPESTFRLSPPEDRPVASRPRSTPPVPPHDDRPARPEKATQFDLAADETTPDATAFAAPAIQRGLRELDEFQKDRRPYHLADSLENSLLARWGSDSGPASWLTVRWRKGIGLILRLLRWVNDWAYLISVPFIILVIFAILIENKALAHVSAVAVVLANYGRFWADLLAIFVRPFKEGLIHGIAFLFPPYGIYYLATRWNKFKPTSVRLLTSCIPIVLLVLAYAFLPFFNPASRSTESIPEKIRFGERELLNEVHDELKNLEDRLPSAEKPDKTSPRPSP